MPEGMEKFLVELFSKSSWVSRGQRPLVAHRSARNLFKPSLFSGVNQKNSPVDCFSLSKKSFSGVGTPVTAPTPTPPPKGEGLFFGDFVPEPLVRSYRSAFDFRFFDRLKLPSDRKLFCFDS